jgi:hypothetical protein
MFLIEMRIKVVNTSRARPSPQKIDLPPRCPNGRFERPASSNDDDNPITIFKFKEISEEQMID